MAFAARMMPAVWRLLALGLVAAALGAACGDNLRVPDSPLPAAEELVIVAHQDDDLLFMQPDLFDTVSIHRPVTIVYVTAGDNNAGLGYVNSRITASKFAYGTAAGSQAWQCAWADLAKHRAQMCRLVEQAVTLVFLGYPDGGVAGENAGSLLRLFEGTIPRATTIADQTASYDRAELVATLGEIITATQPALIRTLEVSATHGDDHSDHMLVGTLATLAVAATHTAAAVLAYRGYNVNFEPANVPDAIFDQSSLLMRAYEACQVGCGVCGVTPCDTVDDPRYNGFLHRRYAVGIRQPPLTGVLRAGSRCLAVADGKAALVSCAKADAVSLEAGGAIRAGDGCLSATPEGDVVTGECDGDPARHFLFDDEGHLWAGLAPAPDGDMTYRHSTCLYADGDRVAAGLCGADRDARWELLRPTTSTPRTALDLAATGRAVRLADLTGDSHADLCAVEHGRLACAPGDGAGGFEAARTIDTADAPLEIEPESLVLGDVDGDDRTDACGRTALGIACATAANGFATALWSPAFAHTGGVTTEDRSLAIVHGSVCGLSRGNVLCVHGTSAPQMLSAWPGAASLVWPASLDDDAAPDWCTSTAAGPVCGLAADRAITTDGVPWGYSEDAMVEGSVAVDGVIDSAHSSLADITGDGRADLCVALGDEVQCAIAQDDGFGPRATVLALPAGETARAVWLGDLDGDGKADPCVDTGAAIVCALSP